MLDDEILKAAAAEVYAGEARKRLLAVIKVHCGLMVRRGLIEQSYAAEIAHALNVLAGLTACMVWSSMRANPDRPELGEDVIEKYIGSIRAHLNLLREAHERKLADDQSKDAKRDQGSSESVPDPKSYH